MRRFASLHQEPFAFPSNVLKENAMKHVVLPLAALAVVGLATCTASAAQEFHGYLEFHAYSGGYHGRQYSSYRRPDYGSRGGYYGGRQGYYGGQYYGSRMPYYRSDPHTEAVRRIKANYSRYRFNPHPRSYYKSPPYRW